LLIVVIYYYYLPSAGVIAARTLHEQGHDNFVIIEARDELGGRLMSRTFGTTGRRYTIELGANWVQGKTFSAARSVYKQGLNQR